MLAAKPAAPSARRQVPPLDFQLPCPVPVLEPLPGSSPAPLAPTLGGIAGAIVGGLVGGFAGGSAGAAVGEMLDETVLDSFECLECDYRFSAELE